LNNKRIRKAEVVHHIKELRDYPSLSLELSNLISWCNICHTSHHKNGEIKQQIANKKIDIVETKINVEIIE